MRVVHIASISEDPFNGVCVVVPEHVRAQSELADVRFVNVSGVQIGGIEQQLEFDGRLPRTKDGSGWLEDVDIVVFHEVYRTRYLRLARVVRAAGVPYIIVPHGELGAQAQSRKRLKKRIANRTLFRSFIQGASAIQCLSTREFDETSLGSRKFISVNGVAVPAVQKSRFREQGQKIVYVGRLEAVHKGLDLMIEAAWMAADELRQSKISIVIHGPDFRGRYDSLQALIRKYDVGDIVCLKNEVVGAEKVRVLMDADAFIQTSRFEGMPLGVLEALSYGLPCLLTEGTNLASDVCRSNAGWTAQNFSQSIAGALRRFVGETDRLSHAGANARQLIVDTYSWQKVSAEAIRAYVDVIGSYSNDREIEA